MPVNPRINVRLRVRSKIVDRSESVPNGVPPYGFDSTGTGGTSVTSPPLGEPLLSSAWRFTGRLLSSVGIIIWSGVLLGGAFLGGFIVGALIGIVVWIIWFFVSYSNAEGQNVTIGYAADVTPWWGDEFAGAGAIIGSTVAGFFVLKAAYGNLSRTWS